MSKPFDVTTKELLEKDPRAWLNLLLGRDVGTVRVLNVDLSTITAEVDSLLLVESPEAWIVHVEIQTTYHPDLPYRLLRYNVLARGRKSLPVQSIILLLRPQADGPAISGLYQEKLPDGFLYHEFRYNVVRLWERPVDEILSGRLAVLPLAPISRVSATELPNLIQRMEQRIDSEASPSEAGDLWLAAFLLTGLIYPKEFTGPLFQGIRAMRESSSFQAILEEGLEKGLEKGRRKDARKDARKARDWRRSGC